MGLLIGIADECGLCDAAGQSLTRYDETDYSHTPNVARLYAKLKAALCEVPKEGLCAGDIVLMHVLNSPQHLGVIVPGRSPKTLHLIHAYAQAGKVVEHPLDNHWRAMVRGVFRLCRMEGGSSASYIGRKDS